MGRGFGEMAVRASWAIGCRAPGSGGCARVHLGLFTGLICFKNWRIMHTDYRRPIKTFANDHSQR